MKLGQMTSLVCFGYKDKWSFLMLESNLTASFSHYYSSFMIDSVCMLMDLPLECSNIREALIKINITRSLIMKLPIDVYATSATINYNSGFTCHSHVFATTYSHSQLHSPILLPGSFKLFVVIKSYMDLCLDLLETPIRYLWIRLHTTIDTICCTIWLYFLLLNAHISWECQVQ